MSVSSSQLSRVLIDLQARTDKLWAESKSLTDLNDFLGEGYFDDYWKYYKELMPFVRDFASKANNEEISRLANKFCKENFLNVERAMNSSCRDDFREAFNETKYTLDNLVY